MELPAKQQPACKGLSLVNHALLVHPDFGISLMQKVSIGLDIHSNSARVYGPGTGGRLET